MHVLLVEDDAVIREATQLSLERDGFQVTVAEDGVTGLARYRELAPDVALLDLMLPGMNGVSLCRQIREEGQTPVIMMSARSDPIDVVLGLEAGACSSRSRTVTAGSLPTWKKAFASRWTCSTRSSKEELEMDLVVTRVFDAPVERVWQAWTESADVLVWWGPDGFTAPIAEMNVREGGTSRICMRSPDGHDFHNTWTYSRVIPLRRLEFLMAFADADWNPKTPAELGLPPDIPAEVRHVVTFSAAGQKTELTVTEFGYTAPQTVEISKLGLEQCLDKMALRVNRR